jgi:alcohol dehydrogenase
VAAANNRAPEKLVGFFKGRKRPLPLFAVPTTAGTGSEATIASVISDNATHAKSFVIDSRTVPLAAALDPRLMESIPPAMTAATGMDALTHAIEAYMSTISTAETDRYAIEAIQLIFEFLPRAYQDGSDLEAREAMARHSPRRPWAMCTPFPTSWGPITGFPTGWVMLSFSRTCLNFPKRPLHPGWPHWR